MHRRPKWRFCVLRWVCTRVSARGCERPLVARMLESCLGRYADFTYRFASSPQGWRRVRVITL